MKRSGASLFPSSIHSFCILLPFLHFCSSSLLLSQSCLILSDPIADNTDMILLLAYFCIAWIRECDLFWWSIMGKEVVVCAYLYEFLTMFIWQIYSPQLDTGFTLPMDYCCFLYQTFDAVDGKQARRTNSSSPLGELFDHGCDALACAFEAMAFGSTTIYFTNTLILPVVNGPTEGLMLIYLAYFFTAIVGAEWWSQDFGQCLPIVSWVPFVSGKHSS
ncbi:Choline/ethanolaminephosphotransferase 1 [Linum perenne]